MFEQKSRYYGLENKVHVDEEGNEIIYKERRFVPDSSSLSSRINVKVKKGQRLDQISASTLGDPELYWKIADANTAMSLTDLEKTGAELRIPLDGAGH